jgi:hypothetical protein
MTMVLCTALRVASFEILLMSYQAIPQTISHLPEGTGLHLIQVLIPAA